MKHWILPEALRINNKLHLTLCPGLLSTWDESSQGLVVLVSIPVGLPPVWVVLADDVQDVPLLEGQPQLPTRHEGVVRGVVVKVRSYVHLRRGFNNNRFAAANRIPHAHTRL